MANTPYYLPPSSVIVPNDVGTKYHIACSASLPSQAAGNASGTVTYGFLLKPVAGSPYPYVQRTDVATKQSLIQYASPNLIDRDLVFYPRVSDGDFSGGMLQTTFIDPQKYWDSTLFIDEAGYLQLPPALIEIEYDAADTTLPTQFGVAFANGYAGMTADTQFWKMGTGSTTPSLVATSMGPMIASDGTYFYAANGTTIYQFDPSTTSTTTIATAAANVQRLWFVDLGTNGYRLYFCTTTNLYFVDLTASFPATPVAVPTGTTHAFESVCSYQTGIAIVTTDGDSNATYIWYHDGQSMTLIDLFEGAFIVGICNCQGNLYATTAPISQVAPQLIQVSSGTTSAVVTYGLPAQFQSGNFGPPAASSSAVYWASAGSPINGIATNYILKYNVVTGALSHALVTGKNLVTGEVKVSISPVAVYGGSPAFISTTSTVPPGTPSTSVYFNVDQASGVFGATQLYASSGWLISSKIDAATPTIAKQFHEVTVTHAPLPAGSSIVVNAYADADPTAIVVTGGSPTTPTATVTNSTTNSTSTVLNFPNQLVAKSMVVALELTAGTSQLTTPVVFWFSVEISTPWAWEMYIDCTNQRRMINQESDQQGVTAKDLSWFWAALQENPGPITLYIPDPASPTTSRSYVCELETLDLSSPGLHLTQNAQDDSNWETFVHCVLRQSA